MEGQDRRLAQTRTKGTSLLVGCMEDQNRRLAQTRTKGCSLQEAALKTRTEYQPRLEQNVLACRMLHVRLEQKTSLDQNKMCQPAGGCIGDQNRRLSQTITKGASLQEAARKARTKGSSLQAARKTRTEDQPRLEQTGLAFKRQNGIIEQKTSLDQNKRLQPAVGCMEDQIRRPKPRLEQMALA